MNGEVKYYRLNDPMKWDEFKKMPKDIKITYIQQIRERFGVSDSQIAKMLGAEQTSFSGMVQRLGIGLGRGHGKRKGDTEGFLAWCHGLTIPTKDEPVEEITEEVAEPEAAPVQESAECCATVKERAIPRSGGMTFEGAADEALESIRLLLGNANVRISVTWDVLPVTSDD